MGFTSTVDEDENGITMEELKAACAGRVNAKHQFNTGAVSKEVMKELRPHCIIYVVSAEDIEQLSSDSAVQMKLKDIYKIVPEDVAKIAVLTKVDKVCGHTNKDIQNIYRSEKVEQLVKKVHHTYGVQENEVFPVVNFVKETMIDKKKTVPLLYAMNFALKFASDRQEARGDDSK